MESKDFFDDIEKVVDLYKMSKEDFLKSYSYLSEDEYFATFDKIIQNGMSRKVFEAIEKAYDFDTAVRCYSTMHCPEGITDYSELKDFAIECINEDNLKLAWHICLALYNQGCTTSEWYYYDYKQGTSKEPYHIQDVDDVEECIGFDIP